MNNVKEISYDDFRKRLENPKTTMTKEKLKELKKSISDSLSVDRHKILMRLPFIGGMLMRMDLVPVRSWRCDTACTDGRHIFFDIAFYKSLNDKEREFVLAHEIWHVIYMHFLRRQTREQTLWNIATDCEINYMLKKEGFISPPDLCYPDKCMEEKNAEEIYEYLLKKRKKENKNKNGKSDDGFGGSNGDNSDNNKGSVNGKLKGQFDKHIEKGSESEGNDGNILPTDEWGEKGEDSDFTPAVDNDAAERIREMIVSEAQFAERTQGHLPGYLENIINKIRNPEINWKEYLAQFVTSCIGDRRVWLPPNRHYVWSGSYFQSRRSEKINVVVTVDTSGSTTSDLPKFMGELIGLLKTFGNYELTLIQCDAEVHDVETYDEGHEFPLDNPQLIKWKGFGGSDLRPAFEEIINRGIETSMHIVFTDGFITFPERNELGFPTLVVLTKDGNKECCDWAEKVVFKDSLKENDF